MNTINSIIMASRRLIPKKAQDELLKELDSSKTLDASPAGAILMGMYILDYVSFQKYVDEILGEEHTTIEQLKKYYQKWHTGPLLGIEPSLLNDNRIGRAMSAIGTDPQNLQEILFGMITNAGKNAGIPLNKFILMGFRIIFEVQRMIHQFAAWQIEDFT